MPTLRLVLVCLCFTAPSIFAEPLPDTQPLEDKDDLALKMVDGIGKYLDRERVAVAEQRKQYWKLDFSSPEAYAKSVAPNRARLMKILGVVDERVKFTDLEYVGGPQTPSLVAETDLYKVHAVRWPVLPGVDGEGLLLEPKGKVIAQVVAIPDADWTPEQFVGLAPGVPTESQFARRLAENGCRVIVPVLIDRKDDFSGSAALGRWTNQPGREFIYRMAYEMGRHVIGYEVQKVLAAVDWFIRKQSRSPIGVWGLGEGAQIALFSAACDPRIDAFFVDDPSAFGFSLLYRNIWSMQREFGDLRILHLIDPRGGVLLRGEAPAIEHPKARPDRGGSAPQQPEHEMAKLEMSIERFSVLFDALKNTSLKKMQNVPVARIRTKDGKAGPNLFLDEAVAKYVLRQFLRLLDPSIFEIVVKHPVPEDLRAAFDPAERQRRQFDQLVAHVQKLWRDSETIRSARFAKCDRSSPEAWAKSVEPIRQFFWEEVIGKLPAPDRPMNPRSREIYDTAKWKGYEITLDLYPDVFAYGILLLPKDLKPNEKRPVVVCQHGLEGRPTDVCNPKAKTPYYNSFGAQLADLGYIVFAPQNPYIGHDRFRLLQRKANPLKLSLFSFIVRQHERILDWLGTQPNVDGDKIAFYGLSYGGKTAMRVPAILPKYCLSICSGDFNEWIGKNVSTALPMSYMFSPEYEMPEFDLGHTFNYAEMAYLIAPRPFMVERGHDDGVGIDSMVASEFAKVRYLYANTLKIPQRAEIEFFAGGHEIHAQGTYRFLKKHLDFPKP